MIENTKIIGTLIISRKLAYDLIIGVDILKPSNCIVGIVLLSTNHFRQVYFRQINLDKNNFDIILTRHNFDMNKLDIIFAEYKLDKFRQIFKY